MDPPFSTPPSFNPNDASSPPHSSSSALNFPHQHAVPAQRVQHDHHHHYHHQHQNLVRQSRTNTHPTSTRNAIPSEEQRTAIANLDEFSILYISSWLNGYRSLLRGEPGFYPSQSSHQQRQAIFALKGSPNELVHTLLNAARSPGTLSPSQDFYGNSNLNNGSVDATSLAQSPYSFSDPHIPAMPPNPWGQESYNSSRDTSVGVQSSSAATSKNHDRWCFICKDQKHFKTRDSFKRHMQEHYETYYCISEGSVDFTEAGSICAVCRVSDPDPRHLNQHNDPKCNGTTYTRKKNMANHYTEKHDVQDSSALAERSKQITYQKYFACGFCDFCCKSHNELINHVDYGHYKFSEHIRYWDDDKVILKSLSQHPVSDYWRDLLTAHPHLQESYFTWKPTDAEELIRRLGTSREPGDILAQDAFNMSNFGISQRDNVQSVPLASLTDEDINTSQSIQTLQRENGMSPLPYTPGQGVTSRVPLMRSPTLPSQPLASDSGQYLPSSRTASEIYGSHINAIYGDAGHRAYPVDSPIGGENFMQYSYPAYWPSTASASGPLQMLEDQAGTFNSSGLGGDSPYISSYVATNPQSRQMIGTHSHPVAHAHRFHPSLAIQSISSPLSSNRETPQLSHPSSAYSPTVDPQSSRLEMRDGHVMDIESDSDNQRRFVQGHGRSRGQRRRH